MVKEEHHSSLLKSLEKSLDVLDLFVECNTGMTLKEIAEHTHLNTSTAFRIVNTLERRQYLTRNDTSKQYRLGPRALALGYSSHWTENVITLAKPYLRVYSSCLTKRSVFTLPKATAASAWTTSKVPIPCAGSFPSANRCPSIRCCRPVLLAGRAMTNASAISKNTAIFLKKSLHDPS